MPDERTVAGLLLVAGPLLGLLGFYDTGLYRVWGAPREEHLSTVAAHRRGWQAINAGFIAATAFSVAGLVAVVASAAGSEGTGAGPMAILLGATVLYALAGAMWSTMLAIRTRTTPALAAMVAAGRPTEPAESILGAATGGLFAVYAIGTGVALAGIGIGAAAAGVLAMVVGGLVAISGGLVILWYLRAGDVIPAVLYIPTLVLGVALLGGGS